MEGRLGFGQGTMY